MKWLQSLKSIKAVNLEWTSGRVEHNSIDPDTKESKKSLVLHLVQPIQITSSIPIYNPTNRMDAPKHETFTNIMEVKVRLNLLEDETLNKGFDFPGLDAEESTLIPETFRGTYEGDLVLDVDSQGVAWLTDQKINSWVRNQKNSGRQAKWDLLNKM